MVTMKVLFLLSLATAKHVSELQALSRLVAFQGSDISLSYLPEFVVKTESERNPLPQFFVVRSLEDFVGDLPEDRLLCPVRALRVYLKLTASVSSHPRSLFHRVVGRVLYRRTLCRSFCVRLLLILAW